MWTSIIVSFLRFLMDVLSKIFYVNKKKKEDIVNQEELKKKTEDDIAKVIVNNDGTKEDPFNDNEWNKGQK